MESRIGGPAYSVGSLFRDEQRKVLDAVLWSSFASAQPSARDFVERPAPATQALSSLDLSLPPAFHSLADVALSLELRAVLNREAVDAKRIVDLLTEGDALGLQVDTAGLGHALAKAIARQAHRFGGSPEDLEALRRLEALIGLSRTLGLDVDLWEAQSVCYGVLQSVYPKFRGGEGPAEIDLREWVNRFGRTAAELSIRMP